jgi:small-conductance mechanosensitive channel
MLEKYGIPLWAEQLIFAVGILVGTLIASYLIRLILGFVSRRIADRTKSELDDILISALSKPLFYLIFVGGIDIEFRYLAKTYTFLTEGTFRVLHGIAFTVAAIIVGWLAIRLTTALSKWYAKHIAVKTETKIDDEFIPIFDRGIKMVVFIIVLMAIMSHFNIDIKGLVAVLGVSSLAVALAAQDTLANMIAGFILMLDRPFRVGDRVILGDERKVDVYEIGLRSTKFQTLDRTLVIIPNAEITKMAINNITYPAPLIRAQIDVGVAYGSDIDKVRELLLEAARTYPKTLKEPEPYVEFINLGDSSLDFRLYAYLAEFRDQWRSGNAIREIVYKIFERENIEIPFPQRVVTMVDGGEGGNGGGLE